jgi:hypothetical protein
VREIIRVVWLFPPFGWAQIEHLSMDFVRQQRPLHQETPLCYIDHAGVPQPLAA